MRIVLFNSGWITLQLCLKVAVKNAPEGAESLSLVCRTFPGLTTGTITVNDKGALWGVMYR